MRFKRWLIGAYCGGCVEHIDKEPIEFSVDLALHSREQAEVHKIELTGLVYGADRLGTVDGIGMPITAVLLEQRRYLLERYVRVQAAWRVVADLPKRYILTADYEEEWCAKRPVRVDECRCFSGVCWYRRESRRPVGRRSACERGQRDVARWRTWVENVGERKVANDRFFSITG